MTNSQAPARPLPTPQPESDFYWQKAREHELWLMHCDDCRTTYFYPRPICPQCFSRNTRWLRSSGKGTLYAFAIVHRAPSPAFAGSTPYVVAFVLTEEGARIPANLIEVDATPQAISIGMSVEVAFEDVTAEITLPQFRPA